MIHYYCDYLIDWEFREEKKINLNKTNKSKIKKSINNNSTKLYFNYFNQSVKCKYKEIIKK